jgi:hypothetical protein
MACVSNDSRVPIPWDEDWSLFLNWWIVADDDDHLLQPNEIASKEAGAPHFLKERIVMIGPGKSVNKEVILTDRFTFFDREIVGVSKSTRSFVFSGVERIQRFVFTKPRRRISIQLRYNKFRNIGIIADGYFVDSKLLQDFWEGACESNSIEIEFP